MKPDLQQFDQLLTEKKYREAKETLSEILKTPLSRKQRGSLNLLRIRLTLELSNQLKKNYLGILDEEIILLKKLNALQQEQGEAVDLAMARKQISGKIFSNEDQSKANTE